VVELIDACDPTGVPEMPVEPAVSPVVSIIRGQAAAAMAGLKVARGDVLVILEPGRGYDGADLARVVEPLLAGEADLVVASRYARTAGGLRGAVGALLRPIFRTSDPRSGLVAITRPGLRQVQSELHAVGSSFTLELANRVRGRKVEVPVHSVRAWQWPGFGWDDLRHVKRLADARFGNYSRLVQFCAVGASGMLVDLICYAAFQHLLHPTWLAQHVVPPTRIKLDLAVARVLAIGVALCWNFAFNRRFTFSDSRSGSLPRQFLAYVLSNLLSIVVSLGLSLGLPRKVDYFHDHKLMAAVVGIVAGTAISFTMARWVVFRKPRRPDGGPIGG
jgi:dolichol-phosphate mannosyltransferase